MSVVIRTRGATFSPCGEYRYELLRWIKPKPKGTMGTISFVMLNPSTADAFQEDPTVRRCLGFAYEWGYEYVRVVNIFAFRATDPNAMIRRDDPIGEHNDRYISKAADESNCVVIAWGAHGSVKGRGDEVRSMLMDLRHDDVHQIGMPTQAGHPRHPLYLKGDTPLIRCER